MTKNASYSREIVRTPYYVAHQYPGGPVGIILSTDGKATDGTPDNRPRELTRIVDENGLVNYYKEAEEDSELYWRKIVGEVLAKQVVKPAVKRQGDKWTGTWERSILGEFPEHYKLYTHYKGDRHNARTDHYLYGSKYVKCFRSPAEFAYHAIWLMLGSPLKVNGNPACRCTYCDPSRTQEEISRELGLLSTEPQRSKEDDKNPRPKRVKTAHVSAPIMAKDYTKLNLN